MEYGGYATKWEQAVKPAIGMRGKIRNLTRNLILNILGVIKKSHADNFLAAIYCHYVFDDQKDFFENILCELKKIGHFVDTDAFIALLEGRKPIDNKYFHLSFDDGFRNIFTNALPILRKYKIPAIFFVPSGLVGVDWNRTKQYCFFTNRYTGIVEMVRWEDLYEMASYGYEIGSHSKYHTRLSLISHESSLLEDEILGSKQDIEENLKIECKYFSWPYGRKIDFHKSAMEIIKKGGYAACFGGFRDDISLQKTSKYSIPRQHFEPQWPLLHIKYFLFPKKSLSR
jgi:hypothetical protein